MNDNTKELLEEIRTSAQDIADIADVCINKGDLNSDDVYALMVQAKAIMALYEQLNTPPF